MPFFVFFVPFVVKDDASISREGILDKSYRDIVMYDYVCQVNGKQVVYQAC